jgi:hypothetical protein
LFVDPETARRREVASGLSRFGYEVIPAVGAEEGRRYARTLGPGIVVAPATLVRGADGTLAERFDASADHTLLLLGHTEEEGRDLPEDVLFLQADGTPTWSRWWETCRCCPSWSCCGPPTARG